MEILKSFLEMPESLKFLAESIAASGKPLILAKLVGWNAQQRLNRKIAMTQEQWLSHFWSKPDIYGPDDCWEVAKSSVKYPITKCRFFPGEILNHRLAYLTAVGPIHSGLWVLHSCDNTRCMNPKHLNPGTAAENTHDMLAKGRGVPPVGIRNGQSKLTESDVRLIRNLRFNNGLGSRRIHKRFFPHVSRGIIQQLLSGETWRHVQ